MAISAVLCHVTALPVVAGVLLVHWVIESYRGESMNLSPLFLWSALILYLAAYVAPDLWRDKGDWSSMATAESVWEWLQVWPLVPMLLIPGSFACLISSRRPHRFDRTTTYFAVIAGSVIIGAWGISKLGLPLWHRRYLVGTLPPLWVFAGSLAGQSRWRTFAAGSIVAGLLWQQSPQRLPGELRSERWRAAVAYVAYHSEDGQIVWLDPGLIEQAGHPTPVTDRAAADYFSFAVRGPYRLPENLTLRLVGNQPVRPSPNQWLISRSRGNPRDLADRTRRFGTLRVITPTATPSERGT